jgi:hypothetical protein
MSRRFVNWQASGGAVSGVAAGWVAAGWRLRSSRSVWSFRSIAHPGGGASAQNLSAAGENGARRRVDRRNHPRPLGDRRAGRGPASSFVLKKAPDLQEQGGSSWRTTCWRAPCCWLEIIASERAAGPGQGRVVHLVRPDDRRLADVFVIQDDCHGHVNNLRVHLGSGRRRYETSVTPRVLEFRARRCGHRRHHQSIDGFEQAPKKTSRLRLRAPAWRRHMRSARSGSGGASARRAAADA